MKKEWVRPLTTVQVFAANEYIASSCGETGTVYKFKCNAPVNEWIGSGSVYLETNGVEGLQRPGLFDNPNDPKFDQFLSGYHPCGEEHEASTKDEFLNGYIAGGLLTQTIPVMVWRGENGDNTHCTTNLNMETWETTKS